MATEERGRFTRRGASVGSFRHYTCGSFYRGAYSVRRQASILPEELSSLPCSVATVSRGLRGVGGGGKGINRGEKFYSGADEVS